MCFGNDGGTTTTTNNVTSLPPWVQQAGAENFSAAKAIAAQPYQYWGNSQDRIPGFTGPQNRAMTMANDNVGSWQPDLAKAGGAIDSMTDPAAVKQLMNPYVEAALAPQLRALDRARADQTLRIGAGAHQAGAFGDARQGVLESQAERDYLTGVSDVTGQGYANAFDRAMQLATQRAQMYGQLGQERQQLGQSDVGLLFNLGEQQRQIDQARQDFAYQEFLRNINYPREQLGIRISALSGVPFPQGQTSTTTGPGPNSFSQNLGAFGLLAGGAGSLYKSGLPQAVWSALS